MQIEVSSGQGDFRVTLSLHTTEGRGLSGFLRGGRAHVGGVAYAVPRSKSSGEGLTADVSSICGPGHKDVYAAQKVAEKLSIALNEPVCICAGIHFDHAAPTQIQQLLDLCLEAARLAAEQYLAGRDSKDV